MKLRVKISRSLSLDVSSLKEASEAVRGHCDGNGWGASDFYASAGARGAGVFQDGERIANVSYNGRVWDLDGVEVVS